MGSLDVYDTQHVCVNIRQSKNLNNAPKVAFQRRLKRQWACVGLGIRLDCPPLHTLSITILVLPASPDWIQHTQCNITYSVHVFYIKSDLHA